jgi:nucleotide-binding universal stress UspA family protein
MILVGMDFRDDSWAALREARSLARATGLPLEVLHVCEYGESEGWEPRTEDRVALEAAGLPPAEVRVRRGEPWVELVRYAKEQKAGIIVAGRHGASGFQPLALGSTAHRLATASQDPVLLVSGATGRRRAAGRSGSEEVDATTAPEKRTNGSPIHSEAS